MYMCKQNNTVQGVAQPYIFSSVQKPVTHGYAGLSHAVSSPPLSGPPSFIPTKACLVLILGRWFVLTYLRFARYLCKYVNSD